MRRIARINVRHSQFKQPALNVEQVHGGQRLLQVIVFWQRQFNAAPEADVPAPLAYAPGAFEPGGEFGKVRQHGDEVGGGFGGLLAIKLGEMKVLFGAAGGEGLPALVDYAPLPVLAP